jgi:hypothetical protein
MRRKPTPLDEDTRRAAIAALRHAAWSGHDQVDELHGRGLLLSPALHNQIRAEAISFLAREMLQWSPAEFLRRTNRTLKNATPADMYKAIESWIQEHAQAARDGL